MKKIEICTNMSCHLKLQCLYFQTAVDFKGSNFTDIKECGGNRFKKFNSK